MIVPPVGGLGVELSIGGAEGLAHGGQSSTGAHQMSAGSSNASQWAVG